MVLEAPKSLRSHSHGQIASTPATTRKLSGQSADTIILAIRAGELKASDLRRPGGSRPRWFIAEDDWAAYLKARSSRIASLPSRPTDEPAPKKYV